METINQREEFENWFYTTYPQFSHPEWLEKNDQTGEYVYSAIRYTFSAWQYQQKIIDELKAEIQKKIVRENDLVEQCNGLSRRSHNKGWNY